ncbi:MAG: hypothetical protein A2736_02695 [Candidatus Yanofskybacteria bacterium RIFCSPHIGHO2_01_FULL_41_27]|uniref:Cohesin domain-containing protein n=2 Tax=Parcubacteria group TaxID=1794811 RepID=A0A0G0XIU1_9BACT|nr:MAG: hypothetical protein UU83_C0019G0002 [Candidatus Jorgensenbacteria bacterium GW2011_GWF2_41_8]OGN00603.1 MAG: hypothetical protein A2736_02695 [Candidatus Yanofskybacteria bacterium RIFCSPHIGHO2_01_FULL_41_27]OGN09210.1 MAG: hypothetical protein A3C64_00505 [Candidatus Yanofskybacteria bacterium RIFCSPHIGHO2_02_FULL_41_12]
MREGGKIFFFQLILSKRGKIFLFLGFLIFGSFFHQNVQAATSYFSPSSGNFSVGNIFTVNVLVNTGGVAINNAEAVINFPSDLLEIVSVGKSGSIFSLWVEEPNFSNSAGVLSFNGGLPTPGFTGTAGKMLSTVFRVKKAGSASLVFSSAAIRANDGYGTDVLKAMNGAFFNISAGIPKQQSQASPLLEILSSTHPDQNKWYSNNDPVFQFKFPSDAKELNLVLSRNETSTPQVRYVPPISEKILEDTDEGVWYLHANYRGGAGLSQTAKYKFQVDTGLPENLKVVRIDPQDTTNLNPKFDLRASDSLSGIDRYEAKIDNGEWVRLSVDDVGRYPFPSQVPGKKQLIIRVYDKADNYIETPPRELLIEAPAKLAWYLSFESIIKLLAKGFDAIINFITTHLILLVLLLTVGAILGQLVTKGIPYFVAEIKKLQFIASEYHASKKLKKLDSKTKLELKILEKDIKKELELLSKIAHHRSLHPDEQYLRSKLERYRNIIKNIKG